MSQLIPFEFESKSVRVVIGENGEPLFVAKDVAAALGYIDTADAVKRHCKKSVASGNALGVGVSPTLDPQTRLISESDVYRLVLRSQLDSAEKFQDWIVEEVIPAIRKTGSYSIKPMTQLELARAQVALLERLQEVEHERDHAIATKAEIGSRREATAMNTASQAVKKANRLEAELDKAKEYCTIKRMQMLYHGQKFSWRLLKSTGIEIGIDPIEVFDANYGTVKAYHADVWREAYAVGW